MTDTSLWAEVQLQGVRCVMLGRLINDSEHTLGPVENPPSADPWFDSLLVRTKELISTVPYSRTSRGPPGLHRDPAQGCHASSSVIDPPPREELATTKDRARISIHPSVSG